jgi:hypothetical protein
MSLSVSAIFENYAVNASDRIIVVGGTVRTNIAHIGVRPSQRLTDYHVIVCLWPS